MHFSSLPSALRTSRLFPAFESASASFGLVGMLGLFLAFVFGGCTGPSSTPDGGTPDTGGLPPPSYLAAPLTKYVDPFIGTGGMGFGVGSAYPGAGVPFGMVKISPDTASAESGNQFVHCAGYSYLDTTIVGWSHIHLHGTGVPDYGNLLLMPLAKAPSPEMTKEKNYRATFSHDEEIAEAGYYAVTLQPSKIRAEVTATKRTAYHRYTYPAGTKDRVVLLRLDHALPGGLVSDAALSKVSDRHLEGWLHSQGALSRRGGGFRLFFMIESETPWEVTLWKDGTLFPSASSTQGAKTGAFVRLAAPDESKPSTHLLRVSLSFVSVEGAAANRAQEAAGWEFEPIRKAAKDAWEDRLKVVSIAGGTAKQQRIFYTALYHTLQMPTLLQDADGSYRGLDKQVHRADFAYYSDFSLWDTYRTQHPLLTLLYPEIQEDFVRSLIQMKKDGGYLPRWPLATNYTGTMVGAPADIVIADSWLKGLQKVDIQAAYEGMLDLGRKDPPSGAAYGGRGNMQEYLALGYVPADVRQGSASVTMEFAYSDFAIAQLAEALGKTADAAAFRGRAASYKSLFDPQTQFFRAKYRDGRWLEDFDPLRWTEDYVEGNAWQYAFFVPYDVEGLAATFGSRTALLSKMDAFFEKSEAEKKAQGDTPALGPQKYYWHGNEPDIHTATMYLQLGRPASAHRWVRWIMETRYNDDAAGLAGNDDAGTLSSWYVFNALGLYPIPATDIYLLTSPIFRSAKITIQGKTIEIQAEDRGGKGSLQETPVYVCQIEYNGTKLLEPWLKHQDLMKGGVRLRFEMASEPCWGVSP